MEILPASQDEQQEVVNNLKIQLTTRFSGQEEEEEDQKASRALVLRV